jgi:hypothetical protein
MLQANVKYWSRCEGNNVSTNFDFLKLFSGSSSESRAPGGVERLANP